MFEDGTTSFYGAKKQKGNSKVKGQKILKRVIAMILCVAVLFSTNGISYTAMAKETHSSHRDRDRKPGKYSAFHEKAGYKKIVYMDGIKFNVRMDQDSTVIIEGKSKGQKIQLEYSNDGTGSIKVGNQKYQLGVNALTDDKVDISVSSEGKRIYEYKDKKGLLDSDYDGQAALPLVYPTGAALVKAVVALLVVLGVVTVIEVVKTEDDKELYDAVDAVNVIEKDKELKDYYYLARKDGNTYLLALYFPLTEEQAKSIVQSEGWDLYTYKITNAYSIIEKAGYKVEGGGINDPDYHTTKGLQFPHFHKVGHKAGLSKFHSLYGTPTRFH